MVFVGDRGMFTQANLDANPNVSTVTALTHAAMKKLCGTEYVQFSMFDENLTTEVILPEEPNIRYGLRKNPVRSESERAGRLAIIAKTEEKLAEIAVPKRNVPNEKLGARAGKIFSQYGTEKYFNWSVENSRILYSRRSDIISDEEQYDGLYVIRSNVPNEQMPIAEVVRTYKSLINVEQAFRNLKTTQLEIHPVFHHSDDRIKAHVFICMLSYYLLWHLQQRLKPLYAIDSRLGTDEVLEIMKSRQKLTVTIGEVVNERIAEPTQRQSQILELTRTAM
jgi:transposase